MRIAYDNDGLIKTMAKLHKSKYRHWTDFERILIKAKVLDYDDFLLWIEEENSKKNHQCWIKKLESGVYEFRIPPKHKHEVLRVRFSLEKDYYTIVIEDIYTESNQPKKQRGTHK